MGFWRREEPLHERLAREGGLDFPRAVHDLAGPLDPRHPFWQVAGIHGVARAREWDAVVATLAPELPGEELEFVALEDGTLVVDLDLPDDALSPLADAVDEVLEAPYHVYAHRREGDVWVAAAIVVDVVEVDEEIEGDSIEIVSRDGELMTAIGGELTGRRIEALEALAEEDFESYFLEATRIDERLWEVTVNAL
jgi:hypothetical protein